MYTLNSTSMRCPPNYQEHQASLGPSGTNIGGGGGGMPPVTGVAYHGNNSMSQQFLVGGYSASSVPHSGARIPLGAMVAEGVPICTKTGETPMPIQAPCPVGMGSYGGPWISGGVQDPERAAGINVQQQLQLPIQPKMSLQQQRMKEEIAREKQRVQQEIAKQEKIIQERERWSLQQEQRQEQQQQQHRQRGHSERHMMQLQAANWQHVTQPIAVSSLQHGWPAQQQQQQHHHHHHQARQRQEAELRLSQEQLPLPQQQDSCRNVLHLSKKEGDEMGVLQRLAQHQSMVGQTGAQQGSQRDQKAQRRGGRKEFMDEAVGGRRHSPSRGVAEVADKKTLQPSRRNEEFVQKFKGLYAMQADEDCKAEHLRAQASTAVGVVGTLDVDRCRQLIASKDVTIVVTDTGTGKSTLIPKAILDDKPDAKVVNAQPRRTPAIKLAQRVAALYGEKVGTRVGYWVRGEHVGAVGETPIMYVTNYTLFLHLLHNNPESIGITHVIFDEFHERTLEVEVLLLMMKLVMERNPGKLKLVLCSATAEASKWACYFENLTVAEYSKANAMYPIHDYYLEDVCKLVGASFTAPTISPTAVVLSVQLHTIILYIKELLKFLAATAAPQHSILVFVPGRTVVEQLSMWIRDNLGDQLDPIPWYRDVELSFIQEALQRESVTKKKVYVATDIAEVSLTLPDVVFVIDSATAKRPHIIETSLNSVAFPPLELLWESSVNLMQRRGRIGRVQQGFFFNMLSREQTQQLLPSESRLGNSVLHEIVLHCLHLNASPFLIFSLCREEPRKVSVQLSLSTLCDGGYIVPVGDSSGLIERVDNVAHLRARESWSALITSAYEDKYRGDKTLHPPLTQLRFNVTLRGLIVGALPFCVESGTIVFHGLITGLTTLAIIAASCVSCKTPFHVPYNVTDKLRRAQLLDHVEGLMSGFKGEFHSDALAGVGAIIAYMAMQREGLSEEGQNAWCEERHLSRTRITDTLLVVKQAKEQLATIVPFEDVNDVDELMEQYNEHALPLSLMCSAAHMHHGIYVLYDAELAQKKRYAGSGVFVDINCCRDRSVPTTCPWERDTVCIPFTLQTIYGRLVGSFSAQLRPEVFNIMLLLFSSRITYDEVREDTESTTFEVTQSGSRVYINCDSITALQLLQLRRLICARLCVLHFLMHRKTLPNDSEAIAEHLRKTESDFGIPPSLEQHPHLLGAMITSSMTRVVRRIEGNVGGMSDAREGKLSSAAAAAAVQPFCRATKRPEHFRPLRQSALVFSSNGCAAYNCVADSVKGI